MGMETFPDCLKAQMALHPSMQPQDAVKLCYQAAFGAEHLLGDMDAARAYLARELSAVPAGDGALYEPVSPAVCRINLSAWKKSGMPEEWLFRMFVQPSSAKNHSEGMALFEQLISAVKALAASGKTPFPATDFSDYMARYREGGVRAVHHSGIYRQRERPAYRIVRGALIRLLPLLERLWALPGEAKARIIAIDGRAASGKTTMAAQLADVLGAGIIHMDDFFLPMHLRTEDRLSAPGGNVHYERFADEVLPHLSSDAPFSYRKFDCAQMDFGGHQAVRASRFRIVEGAYSCHPTFGRYMDIRVMADIKKEAQAERIRLRNGEEALLAFQTRWIPMEESYLRAFSIQESADIVLT